jgi:hypothetical protein
MNGDVQIQIQLQDEIEDSNSRLLTDMCAILFASSGQLQQLSVCPAEECNGDYSLPRPLTGMISIVSSLAYLAVDIPYDHGIPTLAESVHSLKHLKVHSSTLQLVCMQWCLVNVSLLTNCNNSLRVLAKRLLAFIHRYTVVQRACLPALHTGCAHVVPELFYDH